MDSNNIDAIRLKVRRLTNDVKELIAALESIKTLIGKPSNLGKSKTITGAIKQLSERIDALENK